jgi:hypothetical protein
MRRYGEYRDSAHYRCPGSDHFRPECGTCCVTLLFWKIETTLSVVSFLSMLAGILMTAAVALSGYLKRFFKNKGSKP